ncbi:unnamed protein product, partial [Pylaiella littoralis]
MTKRLGSRKTPSLTPCAAEGISMQQVLHPMMAEILRQGQAHMIRDLDAVRLSTGEDDDE